LSLRDIEALLFERGMVVSYETVHRWCDKFGAGFARRVKAPRRRAGTTGHLDEVFVSLRASLYRKQLAEHFAAWHRFTELAQHPSSV
jgi:putative transposase